MDTEDKKGPEVPVHFIDNPHAPEVLATGIAGFWLYQGNAHITLESARINHETTPGPLNRVVIARLVMPISTAQNLAAGLYDFLKTNGYDPVPQPDISQMQ